MRNKIVDIILKISDILIVGFVK